MNTRRLVLGGILSLGLLAAGAIVAQQGPMQNIDPHRNPNLAEAQHMIGMAFEKISVAQRDNHDDMEGHAARAKELLAQASQELKAAAEAADHHRH